MKKFKVGLIGLGEVAQITHLPILETMKDRYEIAALCDISTTLLQVLGEKYQVTNLYTNALELAAQPDLDLVFVLNSDEYHAECAIAAINNKKHVLIEKPMCLTESEADAIIKARDEAGVQVMVGYMRRFAPAFYQAIEEVNKMEKIKYVNVRDILGSNRLIVEQTSLVHVFDDIPDEAKSDKTNRAKQLVQEAIGEATPELVSSYRLLCGLGSHDLSAMRELIGMPNRVKAASHWNGGRFMNIIFEYDDFCASFEVGVDSQRRADIHIEVFSEQKSIKLQYDTPYIRHLPTKLLVKETAGDQYIESEIRPTYVDAYTVELNYLHDCLTQGTTPKTTPEDFKDDLRLFRMIIEQLRKQ
ncbi:gfo/Idh/MocA family oxidoreductase [Paenibacillaceae bacterium]|nr:gfo/Idh/MocA family oxidoreductase [Paenibacillaceae bacterium]